MATFRCVGGAVRLSLRRAADWHAGRCRRPFCSTFICMSNWRARAIMLTMAPTALTLLSSSAPAVTLTFGSAAAVAAARAEQAVAAADHRRLLGIDQLQPPDADHVLRRRAKIGGRHRAVVADRDLRVRRNRQRPAVAQHRQARPRLQHAVRADPEAAGAGVGLAAVRACTAIQPSPCTATSRSRPVCWIAPAERSAPSVAVQREGATSRRRTRCTGTARNAVVSALKPAVDALARLFAVIACWWNVLRSAGHRDVDQAVHDVRAPDQGSGISGG